MKWLIYRLRTFNYVLWKSVFSFGYYAHIIKAKFSFSMKFFWSFSLFLGLLITIAISAIMVPELTAFKDRFEKRAPALFPESLTIKIENGQVSTNVNEPLRIPIPVELFTDVPGAIPDQQQRYLLVVDTSTTADTFPNQQTMALLTKDALVVADGEKDFRAMPFEKDENITIDKAAYEEFLVKVMPVVRILPIAFAVLLFVFFGLLWPLGRLFSVLILSVPLQLLAQFMQLQIPLKKLIQIGLHSVTVPTLIQLLMLSFGLSVPIPFFFAIMYILYNLVILSELRKQALTAISR